MGGLIGGGSLKIRAVQAQLAVAKGSIDEGAVMRARWIVVLKGAEEATGHNRFPSAGLDCRLLERIGGQSEQEMLKRSTAASILTGFRTVGALLWRDSGAGRTTKIWVVNSLSCDHFMIGG